MLNSNRKAIHYHYPNATPSPGAPAALFSQAPFESRFVETSFNAFPKEHLSTSATRFQSRLLEVILALVAHYKATKPPGEQLRIKGTPNSEQ
jgi:hypothetical protein